MRVLAIDTSSRCGCVGISEDGAPLGELALLSKEAYSASLLPSIEWLLSQLRLTISDIEAFGVTMGPGSFTGLRVGLSTIKGLAWAAKKPVTGLTSLEVLAHNFLQPGIFLAPMLDARKGRVYGAVYRWTDDRLETVVSPRDTEAAQLLRERPGPVVCFGDGARKYKNELEQLKSPAIRWIGSEADIPRGLVLARLAHEQLSQGLTVDIHSVEPIYMRPSEAELGEQRKREARV
ncbi:MAG TPA: tRNA (adenosine(37)-N6)-threonylcarbamoyltransferase complex dimerization subunit type 1 TsaB [Bdellovibrionota bacterium]|nr:tRNA (adenosine(37)-N6)-threonylcarbamoyltransferase complex dimerization subunit type 1 TsaB [Bdellovibrionota bacterium]